MGYIKTDFIFEFCILELCRNHINYVCFFCFKKSHPVANHSCSPHQEELGPSLLPFTITDENSYILKLSNHF